MATTPESPGRRLLRLNLLFDLVAGAILGLCLRDFWIIYWAVVVGIGIVVQVVIVRKQRPWRETIIPGMLLGVLDVFAVGLVLLALAARGLEINWVLRCVIGSGVCLAMSLPFWFWFERDRPQPAARQECHDLQ